MKFIRFIRSGLALVIALAAVLFVAALVPAVQTWAARMALAGQPGLRGSLGSLSVGFGKVVVEDLTIKADGAALTLPSLEARLPITAAVWHRTIKVQSLVAKGWTLDLSRAPEPGNSPTRAALTSKGEGAADPAAAVQAREMEHAFRGILDGWQLPCDVSLDGVDLEGDVLVAVPFGKAPARVHVILKGGGVAAGREGIFTFEAAGALLDPGLQLYSATARGRVTVAMDSPRIPGRIEIKTGILVKGGSLPEDLALAADIAAARGSDEETCTLELNRGSRHLAAVRAGFANATRRLAGTWTVNLRDADLAPFTADRPLPSLEAAGDGTFDADTAFNPVHALGRLKAVASHLGVLAPPLEGLGTVTLETRFDLARRGQSIRFESLSVSLAGTRPALDVRSLQPFDVDAQTGDLAVADPSGDWMEGSIRAFPLAWLSGLTGGFTLAGSDAAGEFTVRADQGGFALRPKKPLAAGNVCVQQAGRMLARGLDVSLSLLADYGPQGWRVQWAPLTVGSAGRRLASLSAEASRLAGAEQPIVIAGTWSADLEALAAQPATRWIAGRSASGDFSANVGTTTAADAKLAVVGHDPGRSMTASVHVDTYAYGAVAFIAPVKIAFGSSVSEVSAEGTWTSDEAGSRVDAKLTGEDVALEHLGCLAAPMAAVGGVTVPAGSGAGTPAQGRDRIPFWGDWVGRLTIAFDRLRVRDSECDDVGGTFDIDHGAVRLENGRCAFPHDGVARMEGSIAFNASAEFPYGLKAAGAVDKVDAALLFAPAKTARNPVIEGRFSLAGTLAGNGANLDDLVGRTREEFRLTSTAGIVRLLKTSVAESIPEAPASVSDTLGAVGSSVGSFFGLKRGSAGSGETRLGKNTEAVLDFTGQTAEIGCDQITVAATRGPDGTIHLVEITMTAADERLTGSGEIACRKGLALREQPLKLDLQFGARGRIAELLSSAGLLSSQKDRLGYTLLNQPIHFGGTLEQIDQSQWHGLLVEAATRKPDGGKKGGSADSR